MLTIKNLSKSYSSSEVKALDGVSLELKPGEIFGFLGPNGAGKTTAIKIVTGILPFEQGSVSIAGRDIKTDPIAAKREIGFVPDTHIIYDKLTGREYVDFMADVYGVPLADRGARAEKLLKLFALTDSFDAPIKTYSHGMKQKINIIGALIHNPKLWILDEPMTGLDPNSAFVLKELMREHCEAGNTVFFSTHVLEVAEKICDRVAIIVKGKIVVTGSVAELKSMSKESSLEEIFLSVAGDGSFKLGTGEAL
ncbi:MAG: ABC transporter ATP-binding protein [Clostridiales bacterium]|jgi:ABC-2 type transport system ATP-binding protein|nr:ABC transporter ATP-binding protein [Clostridiales bacterium]